VRNLPIDETEASTPQHNRSRSLLMVLLAECVSKKCVDIDCVPHEHCNTNTLTIVFFYKAVTQYTTHWEDDAEISAAIPISDLLVGTAWRQQWKQ
jgi:hypothetical protein